MEQFKYAHASQQNLELLLADCLAQLGDIPAEATLGFIYISDHFAEQFAPIIHRLKSKTGIEHWAGSVAMGVIAGNHEYYNQPAIAIMLADINEADFRLLPNQTEISNPLNSKLLNWCKTNAFNCGLIHGDPSHHDFQALLAHLGEQIPNAFLIGGISSSHHMHYQLADNIYYGGISGVLFSDKVSIMSNLTQGCLPIGNRHRITHAEYNVAYTLDHKPALEVLSDDVGHLIQHNWNNAPGLIFAGLLQPHSDINDYTVRQIIGLDLEEKIFALGDHLETDDEIIFCSRDTDSALEDMRRMLLQLKSRLKAAPKGGIYISCMGRGPQQFSEPSQETELIRSLLGEFPLIGFFANGEIHKNSLYGFTGVLCLFN